MTGRHGTHDRCKPGERKKSRRRRLKNVTTSSSASDPEGTTLDEVLLLNLLAGEAGGDGDEPLHIHPREMPRKLLGKLETDSSSYGLL